MFFAIPEDKENSNVKETSKELPKSLRTRKLNYNIMQALSIKNIILPIQEERKAILQAELKRLEAEKNTLEAQREDLSRISQMSQFLVVP